MTFARRALPILFFVFVFALPIAACAALLPSEIIPAECHCDGTNGQPVSAPDFGCVLQVVQNLMNFGVMIGFLALTLSLAYGGFMWIINPINPEGKEQARKTIMNSVIGIMIVLSAWLIVDFIMKQLYNDGSPQFGPWEQILYANAGTECIQAKASTPIITEKNLITGTAPTGKPATDADGKLDNVVQGQSGDASTQLNELLTCVAKYVPANVGKITSISDSNGGVGCYQNHPDWPQCTGSNQKNCCFHGKNSCHYGGKTEKGAMCGKKSFAVDFGDGDTNTANETWLIKAANACKANYVGKEGNHVHMSAENQCGCN